MASIRIQHSYKNLIFASLVAEQTGAEFEEQGQWIEISDTPELTIPYYSFSEAFDPDNKRDPNQMDRIWRSLILNKDGYLKRFDEFEIIISDDKPKDKRPSFLLRFPDQAAKQEAEEWSARTGYDSLTEYILDAIRAFNETWQDQAGE